jgi:DNA mismatch repair protein MutL
MLKVLPPHIANLIAAGEVVQRPASVVKELMENSIDAGAENITVIISDSGRTLIQVIDDGCGMSEEDAKLCFARHATSKISNAEDLHSILTYGFRGEALPSIAAVAEVSLKTRKRGDEIGTEVVYAESGLVSQEAVSCPEGTNISVRNIFYNIPARRKFLKSDASEFRQIVTEFCRVALCHYEVSMKLIHNKKDIYTLKGAKNIKQRILEISGKELVKEIVDIRTETSVISLYGFIGKPEDARKNAAHQYFFVNGRFFKSAYLHKAIQKGYEKLIPDGYSPSYFIFFEVNPENIDINIHPSKTEIKFEEEHVIFQILNAAVRESLGMNSLGPSIDFDMEGVPEIPVPHKSAVYTPPPKIDFDPLFNPFDTIPLHTVPVEHTKGYTIPTASTEAEVEGYGEVFEEKIADNRTIIQIQGKYLLTSVKSGILLIHTGRARERILYEKYLKMLDDCAPLPQESLFPTTIELDAISYSLLDEAQALLLKIGFDISFLQDHTISVNGLPEGYSTDIPSVRNSIDELVILLSDHGMDALAGADGRHEVALSLAKSGAKGSLLHMSQLEAQFLIDSLFACTEPDRTPDGRVCMSIITTDDLDKKL